MPITHNGLLLLREREHFVNNIDKIEIVEKVEFLISINANNLSKVGLTSTFHTDRHGDGGRGLVKKEKILSSRLSSSFFLVLLVFSIFRSINSCALLSFPFLPFSSSSVIWRFYCFFPIFVALKTFLMKVAFVWDCFCFVVIMKMTVKLLEQLSQRRNWNGWDVLGCWKKIALTITCVCVNEWSAAKKGRCPFFLVLHQTSVYLKLIVALQRKKEE